MTLFERLAHAVSLPAPADLLTGDIHDSPESGLLPAAVLVAFTDQPRPSIILTVRRPELRRHAGQIAFPGGRLDPGEDDVGAALREAEEEVGMPQDQVRIAGGLDPYVTITGYRVTPILAAVPGGLTLAPHESEVSAIFEAPVDHLLDTRNHILRTVLVEQRQRHYYEIMWEDRRIWGATAAMIVNLSKRLQWP
jgi:8-oxo-dGTP pyrophosphatase MutT (NUDIX family)